MLEIANLLKRSKASIKINKTLTTLQHEEHCRSMSLDKPYYFVCLNIIPGEIYFVKNLKERCKTIPGIQRNMSYDIGLGKYKRKAFICLNCLDFNRLGK